VVTNQKLARSRTPLLLTAGRIQRREIFGGHLVEVGVGRVDAEPSQSAAGEAVVAVASEEPHRDQAAQDVVAEVLRRVRTECGVGAVFAAVADEFQGDLLALRGCP
jgi:hypothetical protein